jgi:hypothetical protein
VISLADNAAELPGFIVFPSDWKADMLVGRHRRSTTSLHATAAVRSLPCGTRRSKRGSGLGLSAP